MEVNNPAVAAHISAVSRAKAANGDGHFSAETLRAVQNGAVAPTVARPIPETEKSDTVENQEPSEQAQQLAGTGTITGITNGGLSGAAQSLPEAGTVLNIVV